MKIIIPCDEKAGKFAKTTVLPIQSLQSLPFLLKTTYLDLLKKKYPYKEPIRHPQSIIYQRLLFNK
jgi:hypothetical protein